MTDAQTEARAIVEQFPAWPTGWGLELRNRVIEEIATALAAKDAELAKRPDWATVNATYEKWKARAERAEAQLAEANKALEHLADTANAILGADPYDSDAQEAFEMFNIARDHARTVARRAREAQGGENG